MNKLQWTKTLGGIVDDVDGVGGFKYFASSTNAQIYIPNEIKELQGWVAVNTNDKETAKRICQSFHEAVCKYGEDTADGTLNAINQILNVKALDEFGRNVPLKLYALIRIAKERDDLLKQVEELENMVERLKEE